MGRKVRKFDGAFGPEGCGLPFGQGGGASHQRVGMHCLARRAVVWFSNGRKPGCPVFAAKGGIKNGAHKGAHLPSGAVLYTSRGRSPQPACKAKPITGRTLGAQGQRPGGAINPHARKGVSTFGNTGKHRPGPGPDRAERRLNPHAPKDVSPSLSPTPPIPIHRI